MSDYLFAHPTFWSGIARSLDLGGGFDAYNDSRTPEEADAKALRADWLAAGRDIVRAISAEKDRAQKDGQGQSE